MNAPVPPGQHLDDDRLSALVDGEPDPVAVDHLAGCGACGARCTALRSVAASVATPPDANARRGLDGALAAARQAWMTERAAAVAPGTTAIRPPEDRATPASSPLGAHRRRGRPWTLGMAAASAALLGAVALATSLGGGGPDRATDLASAPPTDAGQAQDAVAADAPTAATPMANDRSAAEAGPLIAAAPSGGAPGPPVVADLGDQFELAVVADLARQALAAPAAADAGDQPEMLTAAPAAPPCAAPAAAAAGAASTGASYVATLRLRGIPAVLHVFAGVAPAPDGAGGARAVVMSAAGCALLGVSDL